MTSKSEFSRGEVLAEKYEVVDRLDRNPLGVTYRVKQLDSGDYAQLVWLNSAICAHEKLVEQAYSIARSLSHPHLARVLDLGRDGEGWYYTFEDFDGTSLRELLVEYQINDKQFSLKEAAQICMQILEALVAMHRSGQILRALRPEYVLVNVRRTGPRQQTLVADTKLIGAGFWTLVATQQLAEDEFSRGEAQYLAPELKGFSPIPSNKADLYSAGVILYELLVGQAPVGSFRLPKQARPELPDHINNVIELAIAQAPEDRYPSPQDFIQDIQRIFQEGPALEPELPTRPLINPVGWGIALVVVLFIGVLLLSLRPDQRQQQEARDTLARNEVLGEIQASRPPPEAFKSMYARHPPNMVYIPKGPFLAGRLHVESDAFHSEPLAEKRYTEGYLIDVFEHPNLQGATPTVGATWAEASALCAEQGKRLCTADEWERACKGPLSKIYSYGDYFDPELCGDGIEGAEASGVRKACRSDYGLYDLSGGFREWTSTEDGDGRMLVKGGLKSQPERGTRCGAATDESALLPDRSIGFRCCRDADSPSVEAVADQDE